VKTRTFFRLFILVCLTMWHGHAAGQVSGTATYRERIALPPDAVFEATLEDVSRADAPAEVIGHARIERPANPPIRFEIAYDPARIISSHRYAVRARILVGGKLFFVTDRSYPVLTGGHGNEVALLLRRATNTGPVGGGAGPLGILPATFAGNLPCADCPGIRHQLELFLDQAFFLRTSYLGKGDDASFDDIGSWTVASDRRTLVLHGSREAPLKFAVKDANTLRRLDLEGREIAWSPSRYDLKRTRDLQPLEPGLLMRGMYMYFADAGRFTECLTGRNWPVAQVQDNAALESAYSNARREPGEKLLVTLDGRVAMRPKMEGEGQQPTLVVERFIRVWPGETCGARFATEALENTYWKDARHPWKMNVEHEALDTRCSAACEKRFSSAEYLREETLRLQNAANRLAQLRRPRQPPPRLHAMWTLRFDTRSARFVIELLPADARLVHEPALGHRKRCHALVVLADSLGVVPSSTCASRRARRRGLGTGSGGNGDRGRFCAELEVAAREFLERTLILEEDDLAVGLASKLESDRDLRHGRVPDVLALFVYPTSSIGAANAHAALAYRREDCVPVRGAEEPAALAGLLEYVDRVLILVGPRRCACQRH
jgi:copper homeostasis protein (lipoprotein)